MISSLCKLSLQIFVIFFSFLPYQTIPASPITSPILNTTIKHTETGYYVISLSTGNPPQENLLLVDSGSEVIWWQCDPCVGCIAQPLPIYNSSISSTYEEISCPSKKCSDENNFICDQSDQKCKFLVSFTGGASAEGVVASEKLNGSPLVFGCANKQNENKENRTEFGGVVGVGRGPYSLPAQLNSSSFSLCLFNFTSSKSSTISFYRSSPSVPYGSVVIPMIFNWRFTHLYYVEMTGISIDNILVPIDNTLRINNGLGGTIVDTGSPFTLFPPEPYKIFRSYLHNSINNLTLVASEVFKNITLDNCYHIETINTLFTLPSMNLIFSNGAMLNFNARQLLIPSPSSRKGVYCFVFSGLDNGKQIYLGNLQLQGMLLTFDTEAQTLVVTPGSC